MISDIGYGLNSLAYLILVLLLFTVRKSGLAKYLLLLATIATMLWSLGFVTILFGPISKHYLLTADAVKPLVWLLFIASCLRNDFGTLWEVLRRPATLFILLPPVATLLLPYLIVMEESWRFLLLTVLALEVLILLEVLYRQSGDDQWAYKPLVLYLGATHLFEFVMYANATMVNQVELAYIASRGYIYLLLMPLLIVAIRRIKHWGVDIFISRDVVLHSSLLMVAGVYLFIMALVGYAINYLGGNWSTPVQTVLIVLSLALLATVMLSNSVRTRMKVFITKHFFANQFDYRVEWVKLTQALSSQTTAMPEVYQNALQGTLGAINYEMGMLVKVSGMDVEVLSNKNMTLLNPSEEIIVKQLKTFCLRTSWLIDIQEYKIKPFNYDGLQLDRTALAQCDFQLALPFFNQDTIWGFALLKPKDSEIIALNWEVRDYLTAVTEQVGTYIFHHEAAKSVAENAQFAAFNRMSAFVLHDLKNVMAQIDLILCNAEQHKQNPEFIEDTFETLHYTKARMDKMLRQLTEKKVDEAGIFSAYRLAPLIERVVETRCQSLLPRPSLRCEEDADVVVDQEKFANVIYHLISNAQQATPDDGNVDVTLQLDLVNNRQLVVISDTGCGMDKTFIEERLFKPFDTTKGNAGMGIGAYDAKNYMESIGGKLAVESEVGQGSTFTLAFPLD
ncbi:PEP-CTERM system histidine kinase PrsK [Alteromonas pelagimontana]|uniref:histidine kinase n=1 Tax=Alteromonas pelagimontana TaxID=1858656 RepID=A0A6M4MBR1_9ALTE|nr:XrtA/PEP-CTERM system histidine kinase PrsK [Alteromonas pelagimontana]QJR80050.1 PEP-CTERM system histidine kinase PrsK [Alteromonas pelagimontana]